MTPSRTARAVWETTGLSKLGAVAVVAATAMTGATTAAANTARMGTLYIFDADANIGQVRDNSATLWEGPGTGGMSLQP